MSWYNKVNVMREIIELNDKDITRIIAKNYNVKEEQVDIFIKLAWNNEHHKDEVCAIVNINT